MAERYWQELRPSDAGRFRLDASIRHDRDRTERRQTPAPQPTQLSSAVTEAEQVDTAQTQRVSGKKVGRNQPCPCGSGKKYKLCHGAATPRP